MTRQTQAFGGYRFLQEQLWQGNFEGEAVVSSEVSRIQSRRLKHSSISTAAPPLRPRIAGSSKLHGKLQTRVRTVLVWSCHSLILQILSFCGRLKYAIYAHMFLSQRVQGLGSDDICWKKFI